MAETNDIPPADGSKWPIHVRRYIVAQVFGKILEQRGTYQEIVEWLYAGRIRQGERLLHAPKFNARLWAMVVQDAEEFAKQREAKP